jgi:hypothetical protein
VARVDRPADKLELRRPYCLEVVVINNYTAYVASPFRVRKKHRKLARRWAENVLKTADKFEREGIKPDAVKTLRWLADNDLRVNLSKRRKNKKV